MPATLTADESRRTRFGAALSEAMQIRGITQAELGEALGQMRQSSISAWTTGTALPPDVETVFRLEKVLKLDPGHLSRLLGFIPANTKAKALRVPTAVMSDDHLDSSGRKILLATYEELVSAAKRRHPTAHNPAVVHARRRVA